jgi:hypothetical protein
VYRSTMLGGAHLVVFLFFDIFLFDFMRNTDIELFFDLCCIDKSNVYNT